MDNAREPVGHASVPHRSPMHVYQLMQQLLRIHLIMQGENEAYPFSFSEKYDDTKVTIDTVYNKESEVYGKKPSIIVSRGMINTQPLVIGDLGTQPNPMKQHLEKNITLVHSSVNFKILDRASAGADLLGTDIFNFLVMARTVFPAMIPIQSIQSITLSEVSVLEEDDHMYFCDAQMSYSMQYKWSTFVETELLRGITLHTNVTKPHSKASKDVNINRESRSFVGKEN